MPQPVIYDRDTKQWLPYTAPALPVGTHCIEERSSGRRILECPGGYEEMNEVRIDAQGKKHPVRRPAPYRILLFRDGHHATRYVAAEAQERAQRWNLDRSEFKITNL